MLRLANLAAALYAFWILMSGYLEPFLLAAGLVCALAVTWLARRMEIADPEGHPAHLTPAAFGYWPWLALEILRSGLAVCRIILDPRLPVSPTLVRFRPSQRTAVGLATHANSITLTPGTLTVSADHDEFLVHGLTRETATATVASEMDRRVRRFEGGD
ncbi:MAG: Na+/H+ antiporter subunit E [Burkholderiales bacterium]|nr:Na+/H+ antiporter subunit E [Burkholderiales bacterium]